MKKSLLYSSIAVNLALPLMAAILITYYLFVYFLPSLDSSESLSFLIVSGLIILLSYGYLTIYPLSLLIKCLIYDYQTVAYYDKESEKFCYYRKGTELEFTLAEVECCSKINSIINGIIPIYYEIALVSGQIICMTYILSVTNDVERIIPYERYNDFILFVPFPDLLKNKHTIKK